jgi:hypothetical protein
MALDGLLGRLTIYLYISIYSSVFLVAVERVLARTSIPSSPPPTWRAGRQAQFQLTQFFLG